MNKKQIKSSDKFYGDKYDKAIKFLKNNPEKKYEAWCYANSNNSYYSYNEGSELFKGLLENRAGLGRVFNCWCLTEVKNDISVYPLNSERFLSLIINHPGIPKDIRSVKIGKLNSFAEMQRIADALRNKKNASKGMESIEKNLGLKWDSKTRKHV